MNPEQKRCRVRIPSWRINDLEAWLAGMSSQGWALDTVDNNLFAFSPSGVGRLRYICHCFYEWDKSNPHPSEEEEEEKRRLQIDAMEQCGWHYVGTYEKTGIFSAPSIEPVSAPYTREQEWERVLTYYRKHDGKLKIKWHLLSMIIIIATKFEYQLIVLITNPITIVILFFCMVALLSIPYQVIRRVVTIRKIKNHRRGDTLYNTQDPEEGIRVNIRCTQIHRAKQIVVAGSLLLLMTPAIHYGFHTLRYGLYPPIPAGGLPVVRLSDLKTEPPSAGTSSIQPDHPNTFNTYHGVLVQYESLCEVSQLSVLYSDRYHTDINRYADLIAIAAIRQAPWQLTEYEHAGRFGFDRIWFDPKSEHVHVVVARKGNTVYTVIYFQEGISNEFIYAALQHKAGS